MIAHCKSCNAEIFWGKTKNGKDMPFDLQPLGFVWVRHGDPEAPTMYRVGHFQPHWATCPHADEHRMKKEE